MDVSRVVVVVVVRLLENVDLKITWGRMVAFAWSCDNRGMHTRYLTFSILHFFFPHCYWV